MDQTFCEKIPLDRQFADLLIKLGQPRIVGHGIVGGTALGFGKQRADAVDDRLLPRVDLAGVDAVTAPPPCCPRDPLPVPP
jgi:hypothetical protein